MMDFQPIQRSNSASSVKATPLAARARMSGTSRGRVAGDLAAGSRVPLTSSGWSSGRSSGQATTEPLHFLPEEFPRMRTCKEEEGGGDPAVEMT
ncbi:MAG: hypothetical protein CL908_04680 [Deltaproteobacteria bacterium]|jgi:hypothetical protein|nr:hypothetical protein [Deltaproteobacteria bacterium]